VARQDPMLFLTLLNISQEVTKIARLRPTRIPRVTCPNPIKRNSRSSCSSKVSITKSSPRRKHRSSQIIWMNKLCQRITRKCLRIRRKPRLRRRKMKRDRRKKLSKSKKRIKRENKLKNSKRKRKN
jgi:hypothetical protein